MGQGSSQGPLSYAEISTMIDETIDTEYTGDVLFELSGIRPAASIVRLLLRETGHEEDKTLSRAQVTAIARVYCAKLTELVGPRLVRRRDSVQRFAFGNGPVGIGVRRSDQGLKIYRCEGAAEEVGVQNGYVIVELQGELIPASTHQRSFGSLVAKSPRPLVLGFKNPEADTLWSTLLCSQPDSTFFLCSEQEQQQQAPTRFN